jgi:hypothetical protein
MKTIKVSNLHPGMKFDQPVFIEGDNILVPAGVAIKDKDIERLSRWDIEEVFTEGVPSRRWMPSSRTLPTGPI